MKNQIIKCDVSLERHPELDSGSHAEKRVVSSKSLVVSTESEERDKKINEW